ncbi:MAG: chitobiase/beta-hexosaminidase C-terminal domain-containing protein [Bacteroidaceae bacterium]|nr:chitobiase/beta-hexosaminidase C-terminal domain-containing protein [Bacteroidaceae bacterium]
MKKTLRLSLTALFLSVFSMAHAATWVRTDASSLTTGDVVAIVDVTSSMAMPNDNGTSAAPAATAVTLNEDQSEITSKVDATLQWVVTVSGSSLQFGIANTSHYLYCTDTNNGLRVGTNDANTFEIKDGYLHSTVKNRYIGVYNNQDWRCYTTVHTNIKETVLAFYKKIGTDDEPEEPVVNPSIANTPETAYTVAEARALIEKYFTENKAVLKDEIYVKGVVVFADIETVQYGNATFWMKDKTEDTDSIEAFRCFDLNGEKFTDENKVVVGDTIVVKGSTTIYNDTKNNRQIYEFNAGCYLHEIIKGSASANTIAAPTFSLESGTYNEAQQLTITAPEGYGIIYTTDDSTPVEGNGTYVEENTVTITLSETTTVKAITVDNDDPDNCSSVKSATYTIITAYNTAETALTVTEALAFIAKGEGLDRNVYTKGTICKIDELSTSFGNATYYIANETDTLEVYRGYGLNNEKFTAADDIAVGDVVIVCGKLVLFKDTTPEYTTGSYIVSQDKSGRSTEPEEPKEITHITIAEFLSNADTNTTYELTGVVTEIVNTTYGNLYIQEGDATIYIYGVLDADGASKNFESLNVEKGDTLTITGVYSLYKDEPQIKNAQFVSVVKGEAAPEPPYELAGNGSLSNPYTIEDIVKGIYVEGDTITGVWVKGTILGCVNTSRGNTLSTNDPVNSNIALGTEDGTIIIPVQLPYVADSETSVRAVVNIVDNPDNVGKTIYLYGDVIKYCGVAGLKNTSDYSWDGTTTAISNIATAQPAAPKTIFTLSGQKVRAITQSGIYIVDGKKVYVK